MMVTGETEDMKSFIYAKIRFIGVLFLLILFNSITVFAAGNEEYFRSRI